MRVLLTLFILIFFAINLKAQDYRLKPDVFVFSKVDTNIIREVKFDFTKISINNTLLLLNLFISRDYGLTDLSYKLNRKTWQYERPFKGTFISNFENRNLTNINGYLIADLIDIENCTFTKCNKNVTDIYLKREHIYYLSSVNEEWVSSLMMIGDSSVFFIDELVYWKQDSLDYRKWSFDTTYTRIISKESFEISQDEADRRKLLALYKWMRRSGYPYKEEDYIKVSKFAKYRIRNLK